MGASSCRSGWQKENDSSTNARSRRNANGIGRSSGSCGIRLARHAGILATDRAGCQESTGVERAAAAVGRSEKNHGGNNRTDCSQPPGALGANGPIKTTASAAIPSPRPVKPNFSDVVAFTLTRLESIPHMSAIRARMASAYGAIFGNSQIIVQSRLDTRIPAAAARSIALSKNISDATPCHCWSDGGNQWPISHCARAPNIASVIACRATSASECPSRLFGKAMSTPQSVIFFPALNA